MLRRGRGVCRQVDASEAPSEATAACPAAELVWVAADLDRACGVRRRGARWRLRAGLFASLVSAFARLLVCFLGCLLAIVFVVLWIRIALRDACTTTSPAFRARRVGDLGGAVDMDSNASRAAEVERKVWRDNNFSAGQLLSTQQLVVPSRYVNPAKSVGPAAPCRPWHWSELAPATLLPLRLRAPRHRLTSGA